MEPESQKLHSHKWKLVKCCSIKNNMTMNEFKCIVCGEYAYGSDRGPTVYATYITRGTHPMSCNDALVKDIIK